MSMTGVIANTLTVIIGSLVGLTFRKGIPEKVTSAVMTGLGLCSIYIGIDGALSGENVLIVIAAMVVGSIIGTLLDIDQAINNLGTWVENRYSNKNKGQVSITQGFVTASLLFCVGAMTINGSLNAGISGDNSLLYTKAMLDLFSSSMLAASLGIGVLFASAFVLGFQGLLVLMAGFLAPVLTPAAIAEMTCAGSLIIIALGTNLIGATDIKVANYLPAIAIAPFLCWLVSLPVFQGILPL
ncbi:MAG: DUF554 domain-containing protein [Lachnospiraceae bacterium]|nr:DUF554 domain-containing protein [Lachnospiraceae bacterium]